MLNKEEQMEFLKLLKRVAQSDDMSLMQISNKAQELLDEINNL